jgi:hypothetical protein
MISWTINTVTKERREGQKFVSRNLSYSRLEREEEKHGCMAWTP